MPEGINLWHSGLHQKYEDAGINLVADGSEQASVSAPSRSTYLRPYENVDSPTNLLYGTGYNWVEAHYLNPIAIVHFRNAATDSGNPDSSVIYQNPGWPKVADQGPKM